MKKLKIVGKADVFAFSPESAEITYTAYAGECSQCGQGSLEYYSLGHGECESVQCDTCYNDVALSNFDIELVDPADPIKEVQDFKVWAKSKDYETMYAGADSMTLYSIHGNKSFEDMAREELGY